jgi:pyruvate kinase
VHDAPQNAQAPDLREAAEPAGDRGEAMSTVIVVTLGPSSASPEAAAALRDAGADAVRLNGSHLDVAGLRRFVAAAIEGGFEGDRITLDLQGGKTRIDGLGPAVEVHEGQEVLLTSSPRPGTRGPTLVLPVDRPEFLEALEPGDTVRIDDGRLELGIVESTGTEGTARALGAGRVSDRKGLALAGREVGLAPRLLDADRRLIQAALELGVGTLAVSYAAVPGILQATREAAAPSAGGLGPPRLVAKLEQPEALGRLEDMLASSDALWLCRGDLGAEVGLARLPALQRRFLDATLGRATVLVAGQVLHHMTVSPRPTRSEACHVGDLVERGVAGFVLSDETATGDYGPEAVRFLRLVTDEGV